MNTALTATYALTVLLLIATPGPVVALIVNTAAASGSRKAIFTALGTNWASLVLIGAAAWIILTSAAIDRAWLGAMSLLGCLFIGYIAAGTLREALKAPHPNHEPDMAKPAGRGGLWQGFMVGISNPKDIIFFIAFFPQFIQITESFGKSMVVLSLLWIVIDFAVLSLYIFAIGKIASARSHRFISLASGVALLLIAIGGLLYNLRELTA
ncbi:threonine/homoserine/homoserine lactone efflux protein [Pseudomonas sp. URMO17WK12:I10]|uniref:LysE family translocator n=1 Tax=Pseudomonas TaxID=286 RepID=UPI00047FFA93|nr:MULTISPECIES: LysE family translocator [unclassified Pseudomonas]RDL19587.1 threonine/homoserine/homoserine lactone efflux protein [Pseudomonas sp. LAMO17WK12:I3]RED10497.1 threonine/homoserine/homoserine lactone efflux protein [Pseudomonas sp. URMO17WK12:I10]CRN04460.1 Leucine efflux protein [Pseudomonas sp. URMO17WK12:I11]SOD08797.1 Threonine/homoserine/homoserine lactone efflux protein [Pseudomonas sp. URMO17WK12:I9]